MIVLLYGVQVQRLTAEKVEITLVPNWLGRFLRRRTRAGNAERGTAVPDDYHDGSEVLWFWSATERHVGGYIERYIEKMPPANHFRLPPPYRRRSSRSSCSTDMSSIWRTGAASLGTGGPHASVEIVKGRGIIRGPAPYLFGDTMNESLMHAFIAFTERDPATEEQARAIADELAAKADLDDASRKGLIEAACSFTRGRIRGNKVLESLNNPVGKALEGADWDEEVWARLKLFAKVAFTPREAEVLAAWARARTPLEARLTTMMLRHNVEGLDANGVITPAGWQVIEAELAQMSPLEKLTNLILGLTPPPR